MHWPDYHPRQNNSSAWRGLGILVVLIVSLLLAGEINGWWQIIPTPDRQAAATTQGIEEAELPVSIMQSPTPVGQTRAPQPPIEAAVAPNFKLPDLFDDTLTVALADYAGFPVVLNFWASWCVPCKDEMPALESAYLNYQDQGLIVLGINQLYIDDLEAAQGFVTDLHLTFPIIADKTGQVSEQKYGVIGLPTSVFIKPNGEIAHVQIGQMTDEQIDNFSQRLMAGESFPP